MIQIIKGNLFEHLDNSDKHIYLAHVVNNVGKWGAGFTGDINRYFGLKPKRNYQNFIATFERLLDALGHYHICRMDMNLPDVVHLCAMDGVYRRGVNPQPLIYSALENSLDSFYAYVKYQDCVVYMPKIGTGLARGNWDIIYKIIENRVTIPTRIFEL